jgi:LysR family transcriptional regulator for metE and metH
MNANEQMLAAIADEGSVTRAGERLHLTQSALSHQLRELEGGLGTRLFQRLSRRMVPTPAGERLLSSARAVLEQIRIAQDDVLRMAGAREGVLRICTECNTGYHWLPSVLLRFRASFPRVDVRIVVEATRRPIEALLEGKLDLAIIYRTLRSRRLILRPLFQDELLVIMSPKHPLASRPYVRAEDFSSENFIIYTTPEENTAYQRVLAPAGVRPAQITQTQLTEAMVELVKAGIGISVMARWSVAPHIASGEVAARRLTARGLHRQWVAAMLKGRSRTPYLDEFVSLLRQDPTAGMSHPLSTPRAPSSSRRP